MVGQCTSLINFSIFDMCTFFVAGRSVRPAIRFTCMWCWLRTFYLVRRAKRPQLNEPRKRQLGRFTNRQSLLEHQENSPRGCVRQQVGTIQYSALDGLAAGQKYYFTVLDNAWVYMDHQRNSPSSCIRRAVSLSSKPTDDLMTNIVFLQSSYAAGDFVLTGSTAPFKAGPQFRVS